MDSVEWLEMMAEHSQLTDCKPKFARIAEELKLLRKRKDAPMLVEFDNARVGGRNTRIAIYAPAVAWCAPDDDASTLVCISGRESDTIWVAEPFATVLEKLQEAVT